MEKSYRKLIVIRHGERCDFTFSQQGLNWMCRSFDSNGVYQPFDLNMPRYLPKRRDGISSFFNDTPLTEMGYLQSKLTGRALRDRVIKPDVIYCSPSLRCVQTTVGLIKGIDDQNIRFNVEPGLFEWTQWCRMGIPSWMHPDELKSIGYSVDISYVPFYSREDLNMKESLDDYYMRSFALVQKILERHPTGTVLIVAHGASLDTLTRQLCNGLPRSQEDFLYCLRQTPYLACSQAVEISNKVWIMDGSPIPPLSHSSNIAYDSEMLKLPNLRVQSCRESYK